MEDGHRHRYDRLSAGVVGLAAFLFYSLTACPTIFTGDSAELAAAAARFGVPHPPGYPLFTMLTGLLVHLFPISLRAWAANQCAAFYAAGALALIALWLRRLGIRAVAIAFAVASLGFGRTFWGAAVAIEVYGFDLLLLALCLHLVHTVTRSPASRLGSRRDWTLLGLVLGLWLGHRFINLLYLPGLFLLAWSWRGRRNLTPHWGWMSVGFLASSLPFLYLPLASAANPPIDIGDPQTWSRFLTVVRGAPYVRHLAGGNSHLVVGRLASFIAHLPVEIGVATLASVLGFWSLLRPASGRGMLAAGLLWLIVACTAATSRYNILDISSYYLPAFLGLITLGAFGADWLLSRISLSTPRVRLLVVPILLIAAGCVGLPMNLASCDLRQERSAENFGRDLLSSVAPNGVLFIYGDTAIHTAWYMHEIKKVAPQVILISQGHFSAWYFDQLRRRFPGINWPEYRADRSQMAHLALLLAELGKTRSIFFSSDPAQYAQAGPASWWGERTVIPTGMVLEVKRQDEPVDRKIRATENARFWTGVLGRLGPVRSAADLETQTIDLEYALAVLRCADFAVRQEMADQALALYSQVSRFDTDRCERSLRDAYVTIGRTVPLLNLSDRARRGVRSVGGRDAPPQISR